MQANEQIAGRSPGSVVDIPRKKAPKTKRNVALAAGGLLAVVAITVGLSRLKAAAPTVDRGAVWTDTVKRGAMLRQVKGPGTLVPEHQVIAGALESSASTRSTSPAASKVGLALCSCLTRARSCTCAPFSRVASRDRGGEPLHPEREGPRLLVMAFKPSQRPATS